MTDKQDPSPVQATQEDDYFYRRDRELLEKLRSATVEKERRQALEAATGISDPGLLEELDDLGVGVASIAAVSLIPMVLVAWADGAVDGKERKEMLKIAAGKGVEPGSPAHDLLEHWLTHAPDADLFETWESYVAAMLPKLSEGARAKLKEEFLDQCEATARASGGVLGIGSVSSKEEAVIERIGAAI